MRWSINSSPRSVRKNAIVTKRLRTALVLVSFGAFVVWPGARVGAQPDDGLPDDDGAPPEEYEPSADARTAQVFAAEAAATPGPMSPPVDNAFPISGALRRAHATTPSATRVAGGGRTWGWTASLRWAPRSSPSRTAGSGLATPGGAYDCATGARRHLWKPRQHPWPLRLRVLLRPPRLDRRGRRPACRERPGDRHGREHGQRLRRPITSTSR